MKRPLSNFLQLLACAILLFKGTGLQGQCIFPFTENFSSGTNHQNETPLSGSLSFNCMTYKVNGTGGVALEDPAFLAIGGLRNFSGLLVIGDIQWSGAPVHGVSTFSMGATNPSNDFKLTSLDWDIGNAGPPTIFNITGYNNGIQVAKVFNVEAKNQTDTSYGNGTANEVNATYIGDPTDSSGYGLHLVFTGAGWNNMDEIVFSSGGADITMGLDNIVFSPAVALLPLTLQSFTGKEVAGGILLQWKTSNEINTDAFEIERAVKGNEFKVTAIVAGKADDGNYLYTDLDVLKGNNYLYRLKLRDRDGRYTYYPIVSVSYAALTSGDKYFVYPNPVSSNYLYLKALHNNNSAIKVLLTDIIGKTWYNGVPTVVAGQFKVPVKQLPDGIFILQILDIKGTLLQITKFKK